ncbi:hypothetical protein PENSPDRAFT_659067 [Peniophora sp. CONT]|nr:hypothetical protein PENSPDRAFT_659067 [Peniophora sp. CONT]
MLPDGAVWRRCSRVRVVDLLHDYSYTPEDIQSGSMMLLDTLLSDETSGRKRSPGYELLRSYVDTIEQYGRWELNDRDLDGMCRYKIMYDCTRQNIADLPGYDQCFGGPMTVEEQLLVDMVSKLNTFIEEPLREGVRRWKELVNNHSSEVLSLDESQRVDELLWQHKSIGSYFHRLCEYFNLQ